MHAVGRGFGGRALAGKDAACAFRDSLVPIGSDDVTGEAVNRKNWVHRGIPGNAARILRKKYCSSRYP
ncbi:hypothetical protein WJ28_04360 [Burkholderia thailandensis]|nr:hypothetical protein WJ28_04360 [Burkholderia thailandensis]